MSVWGIEMSNSEDRDYHEARAEAELQLAEQSADPSVAMVHKELAALHKRRMIEIVHFGEPQDRNPLIHALKPRHKV